MPEYASAIVSFRGNINYVVAASSDIMPLFLGGKATDQNYLSPWTSLDLIAGNLVGARFRTPAGYPTPMVFGDPELPDPVSGARLFSYWKGRYAQAFVTDTGSDFVHTVSPLVQGNFNAPPAQSVPYTFTTYQIIAGLPVTIGSALGFSVAIDTDANNTGLMLVNKSGSINSERVTLQFDPAYTLVACLPGENGFNYFLTYETATGIPAIIKASQTNPLNSTYTRFSLEDTAIYAALFNAPLGFPQWYYASVCPFGFIIYVPYTTLGVLINPDLEGYNVLSLSGLNATATQGLNEDLSSGDGSNTTLSIDSTGMLAFATTRDGDGELPKLFAYPQTVSQFTPMAFNNGCWPCLPTAQGIR